MGADGPYLYLSHPLRGLRQGLAYTTFPVMFRSDSEMLEAAIDDVNTTQEEYR